MRQVVRLMGLVWFNNKEQSANIESPKTVFEKQSFNFNWYSKFP